MVKEYFAWEGDFKHVGKAFNQGKVFKWEDTGTVFASAFQHLIPIDSKRPSAYYENDSVKTIVNCQWPQAVFVFFDLQNKAFSTMPSFGFDVFGLIRVSFHVQMANYPNIF